MYTRIHNYGSGQCIYVHAHELFVQKTEHQYKTVAPYNHQSLQAEHGIKLLSMILTKHLTEQGQMWPKILPLATLACNTFNSPNLENYSPYEWYLVDNQRYY